MTIECLAQFGVNVVALPSYYSFFIARQKYRPLQYPVEGDWSSVSYLLAAAALSGDVEINNLRSTSLQSDKMLLTFLHEMGVPIIVTNGSFRVKKSNHRLRPIAADLNECIDLVPTMAVLATFADGKSEFKGIARARLKESDRISSIGQELNKAGVSVIEEPDTMTIVGTKPTGAVFTATADHRVAIASDTSDSPAAIPS